MTMPASPWIGSTRNAQVLGVMASRESLGVAEGDDLEAGGEGAEAVAILLVGGEADDGDGAAVEVVRSRR